MKFIMFFVLSGLSLAADKLDSSSKSEQELLENVFVEMKELETLVFYAFGEKSGAEAKSVFQGKIKELQTSADQQSDNLLNSKKKISEQNHLIQSLQAEIDNVKKQISFAEAEDRGEDVLKDARANLIELEADQQNNKQEMARQVKEHKELLKVNFFLDLEIIISRSMMEKENDIGPGIPDV